MRLLLLIALAVLPLAACSSTSHWERDYIPLAPATALTEQAPINVREVPWERLQAGLQELEQAAITSDIAPAEWPQSKRDEQKAKLLRTLQVSQEPASVTIVGRSGFRTTTPLRPETQDHAELVAFARKVGATDVVWSRRLLGKADTIIQEPVTTYSSGADWDHRHRRSSMFDTQTSWVPVRVQADEHAYVAYFLRK